MSKSDESQLKQALNQQTQRTRESAIFFALKLPNSESKVSITKALLQKKNLIDFELRNSTGHSCLEAHSDLTSYDESAALVERAVLKLEKSAARPSTLFLQHIDPNASDFEARVFSQLNFSKANETKILIEQSNKLIDNLRQLQKEYLVTNPFDLINPAVLNENLKQELLNFTGVKLIEQIKQL